MAYLMRVFPSGESYRLPGDVDLDDVTQTLSNILRGNASMTITYEVPDSAGGMGLLTLNGNVVESVSVVPTD